MATQQYNIKFLLSIHVDECYLTGGCQAITRCPMNVAVYAGQTVKFDCRTASHSSVWWKYKPMESNEPECLLFNSKTATECDCDNCKINNTEPGQYDLYIINTRQRDAGTYICVDNKETNNNLSRADSHSAELIVLGNVFYALHSVIIFIML